MNDEYNKRLNEVKYILKILEDMETLHDNPEKNYFSSSFLDFFSNDESDFNFRDYLNISKASLLLMLYNLIESTVTTFIQRIYDEIADLDIEYHDVSEVLQDLWLEVRFKDVYKSNSSFNSYKKKAKELISEIINKNSLTFTLDKLPGVSGNLDSKSIHDVYKKHGINYSTESKAKHANGLLTSIKRNRNDLAHGNKSFMECGREVSTLDLKNDLSEIEKYLFDLKEAANTYILNNEFRKQSS
ncbi:MAE_28990/MAE_18760 family HEPN-like nuclease [Virgibacillus pantothenticus]|uniref:MAE_28990/MAE_18760 family HEPN-like nuclease n=1 Tax=Virgibacillus pantothenticus TaxID=1473 RepID=UPI000986FEEC|nr:MAE_28990/MAE_18760 family HEPN-like nuclease [Virgibacillus pantothenticus]